MWGIKCSEEKKIRKDVELQSLQLGLNFSRIQCWDIASGVGENGSSLIISLYSVELSKHDCRICVLINVCSQFNPRSISITCLYCFTSKFNERMVLFQEWFLRSRRILLIHHRNITINLDNGDDLMLRCLSRSCGCQKNKIGASVYKLSGESLHFLVTFSIYPTVLKQPRILRCVMI